MADDLVSLLEEGRRRYPEGPLFREEIERALRWTSYAEFHDSVDRCAAQLAALDVRTGDQVVLLLRSVLASAEQSLCSPMIGLEHGRPPASLAG